MRFRLRTLLLFSTILPLLIAAGYFLLARLALKSLDNRQLAKASASDPSALTWHSLTADEIG